MLSYVSITRQIFLSIINTALNLSFPNIAALDNHPKLTCKCNVTARSKVSSQKLSNSLTCICFIPGGGLLLSISAYGLLPIPPLLISKRVRVTLSPPPPPPPKLSSNGSIGSPRCELCPTQLTSLLIAWLRGKVRSKVTLLCRVGQKGGKVTFV